MIFGEALVSEFLVAPSAPPTVKGHSRKPLSGSVLTYKPMSSLSPVMQTPSALPVQIFSVPALASFCYPLFIFHFPCPLCTTELGAIFATVLTSNFLPLLREFWVGFNPLELGAVYFCNLFRVAASVLALLGGVISGMRLAPAFRSLRVSNPISLVPECLSLLLLLAVKTAQPVRRCWLVAPKTLARLSTLSTALTIRYRRFLRAFWANLAPDQNRHIAASDANASINASLLIWGVGHGNYILAGVRH
jgi:hypothetical protein